ncbi:MAG: Dictyostelium (slime mold) repeat protein [Methanosaeta sp. PtaU1.Bin060]|nr:MAG: Dictyostelium (slime mold) repeat protein [Methanosaeta sp. PtaU1.Bin060]
MAVQKTGRSQALNNAQTNSSGTNLTGSPISKSELSKSEPSSNNNASKITEILEDNAASNTSRINSPPKDTEFGIINSTESGNQSIENLPMMNANTSFTESMQSKDNSSILQSPESSMNETNESIIGNVSSALLHLCDDGNACTIDTWNGKACVHTPSSCDDNDPCTIDSCENGVCTHKQKDCDDQNESTIDYCLNGECIHSLKRCDDGIACTIDTWNGNECVHTPGNCDDGDPCTVDSCENGKCTHIQKNCDDGDPCTADSCANGKCTHIQKNCNDGDPCTADSCVDGECIHKMKNCDDGNACTVDTCDGRGKCAHFWRNCDDGNPCTIDACDSYWGCTHTPVVCGAGKRCVNGVCQAISTPSASPSSYTIPAGSTINLPWGTAVTAIGSAKVENGIAYTAGQTIKFSRAIGYYQAASAVQGINQAAESAEMVGLSWQSNPFSVTLKKPDGSILSPDSDSQNIKHIIGTNYDYYFLRNPSRGMWNIEISPINPGTGGEGFSLITGLVGGTASADGGGL